MQTIYRHKGFRFYFNTRESGEPESMHVCVQKGESRARFGIEAEVVLTSSHKVDRGEVIELRRVVEQNKDFFVTSWLAHLEQTQAHHAAHSHGSASSHPVTHPPPVTPHHP